MQLVREYPATGEGHLAAVRTASFGAHRSARGVLSVRGISEQELHLLGHVLGRGGRDRRADGAGPGRAGAVADLEAGQPEAAPALRDASGGPAAERAWPGPPSGGPL